MTTRTLKTIRLTTAAVLAMTCVAGVASAQEHHDKAPVAAAQPKHDTKSDAPAKAAPDAKRVGGPYALDTCPISGKKLGTMGEAVTSNYEGREVRFCCAACPPNFQKDLTASLAKLDAKITKDQLALYPLKTSVVTGKELPAKPIEYVYGNRLVLLGAESEKVSFVNHADKFTSDLDAAVVAAQGKDYPIKTCVVSGEALGGMGEAKDVVVAGRLVRLCCNACKKDVDKEPAKFVAMVDAARKGDKPASDGAK